jgi:ATP-dependent helicase/nuclease subunit B
VVEEEQARRPEIEHSFTEVSAALVIDAVTPAFELRARADRIDRRKDGRLAIIDYKTGAVPNMHDVHLGFAPQLPLEAALARRGAFKSNTDDATTDDAGGGIQGSIAELAFWQLNGSDSGGVKPIKEAGRGGSAIDYDILAEEAYDGLLDLLRAFSVEEASYPARPMAAYAPRYSDYHHLARVLEWSLSGETGSGEGGE